MSYSTLSSCLFYLIQFPFHFASIAIGIRTRSQSLFWVLRFDSFSWKPSKCIFHVLHCFRAFYEAKTRGEFEKKEAPAEKPAYWNNSPKHSESEQSANPFLEMKKDIKKQKEVQVHFVKNPLFLKIWIFAPKKYVHFAIKAELQQLNHTQSICLGNFINKKVKLFPFSFRKPTLRFVSCCFRSTHQISTDGFSCLLRYVFTWKWREIWIWNWI